MSPYLFLYFKVRVGERAQQLRVLAALAQDPSLVPSIHNVMPYSSL